MQQVTGQLTGLKPSELKSLERVFRRRVAPHEIVSYDLGAYLCTISQEIGRQVGVLISRRGEIEHVIVGDASRLFLPDVGRLRAAPGRFRGVRLVHTHLRSEPLTRDDLTDLALLKLDLVAAIQVDHQGRPGLIYAAHLLPPNANPGSGGANDPFRQLPPVPLAKLELNFDALIRALESEFSAKVATASAHGKKQPRAILVHVSLPTKRLSASVSSQAPRSQSPAGESASRVAELNELCKTAGVFVCDVVTQSRPAPDPRYLVGGGKLDDIITRAMQQDAELLIFDPDLTPGQARAISDRTDLKVIDRTMLILDIFAQHAKSSDGKLQVELAQLKYTLPRLVEKNTMMSRLTGGIGGRGPGETKLEVSRRRARERITRLEHQLEQAAQRRQLRRKLRGGQSLPTISIVGYTNAGKSTLLNQLTDAQVIAENKLFATLDTSSRRLRFPREREVIITDTVGFIRDLPADLVNAFRATLEELGDADLLVHVVDGSDPARESHIQSVERILFDLGLSEKPRLLVCNKTDRDPEAIAWAHVTDAVAVSAVDKESLPPLLVAIEQALWAADPALTAPFVDRKRGDLESQLAID